MRELAITMNEYPKAQEITARFAGIDTMRHAGDVLMIEDAPALEIYAGGYWYDENGIELEANDVDRS